jgi:hypothetical protein
MQLLEDKTPVDPADTNKSCPLLPQIWSFPELPFDELTCEG